MTNDIPETKIPKVFTITSPPVEDMYVCDVVIPYSITAYPFLRESIQSILNQNFVSPVVHLINDGIDEDPLGVEFSSISNVRLYRNMDGPTGPSIIYSRIIKYLETDVWANQDADDIALPNRLWKSLKLIHEEGYDIVGGSMEQFVDYRFVTARMLELCRQKPYLNCGIYSISSPSGNIVNSTMVMRKSVYEEMNGMAPWFAGADSEFYERCFLAGKKCVAIQDIVSLRRLRDSSISNDGLNGHGSDYRAKIRSASLASIEQQKIRIDHSIGGFSEYGNDGKLIPTGSKIL